MLIGLIGYAFIRQQSTDIVGCFVYESRMAFHGIQICDIGSFIVKSH